MKEEKMAILVDWVVTIVIIAIIIIFVCYIVAGHVNIKQQSIIRTNKACIYCGYNKMTDYADEYDRRYHLNSHRIECDDRYYIHLKIYSVTEMVELDKFHTIPSSKIMTRTTCEKTW